MARITLAATVGDLTVPALLALLAWLGFGWRAGFVVAGLVAAMLAISHASARSLDRAVAAGDDEDEEERVPLRETLRFALGQRSLLAWSIANVLTGLLDEVLVAFSAVHLDSLGATASQRSWAVGAWVVGGLAGLFVLERTIARLEARRILLLSCLVTSIALAVFSVCSSPWITTGSLLVIGAFGATLHPLAKARAYASLPGRPALVNALSSMLLALDMAAPIVLGLIAVRAGTSAAMLALEIAPLGVAYVAWREASR